MEGVISHIPALIKKRGWSLQIWQGHCLLAGLSTRTAIRLYEGETNLTTRTLLKAAGILGISSVADLVEFSADMGGA